MMRTYVLCIALLSSVCGIVFAQSSPEAAQMLQAASAHMLGAALPKSVSISGTITYLDGKSGPVTLSITENDAIVFTTVIDGKERTLRVRGYLAKRIEDGKVTRLPVSVAERMHLLGAPFALPYIAGRHTWVSDANVAVGGHTAFRLITTTPKMSLLLDSVDLQVIAAEVEPSDPQSVPSRFIFGSYRLVEGMYLPFSLAEQVGNQTTWRIRLDNIAVNTPGPAK